MKRSDKMEQWIEMLIFLFFVFSCSYFSLLKPHKLLLKWTPHFTCYFFIFISKDSTM